MGPPWRLGLRGVVGLPAEGLSDSLPVLLRYPWLADVSRAALSTSMIWDKKGRNGSSRFRRSQLRQTQHQSISDDIQSKRTLQASPRNSTKST